MKTTKAEWNEKRIEAVNKMMKTKGKQRREAQIDAAMFAWLMEGAPEGAPGVCVGDCVRIAAACQPHGGSLAIVRETPLVGELASPVAVVELAGAGRLVVLLADIARCA